jgi:type II secretory pathway predicted ATPase ExeA
MTRDPKLQALYGLKCNPFLSDIPLDAIYVSPLAESFVSRCENHLSEGGFALLTGLPGLGKSVTLRLLTARLARLRDVMVRSITYPQCRIGDFYRELGDAFGVSLSWNNRWGSFKMVREKWQQHLETSNTRPILIIDEAQETLPVVLRELRLLTSKDFDSQSLLFVVLAGDMRLADHLRTPDLLPLESRLRTRVRLEPPSVADLSACLRHVLDKAGNAQLLTNGALAALVEHSIGNPRTMMILGNELLHAAVARDARQIDEKLFFEVFAVTPPPKPDRKRR